MPDLDERRIRTVTAVLEQAVADDLPREDLVARLMPVVYDELREVARTQRRRYDAGGFQTTALVHEAYLRMAGRTLVPERAYVFAAASQAMRNVLVDHARRRTAAKRGGGLSHASLTGIAQDAPALDDLAARVLDVDGALTTLAGLDERAANVVECRYFGGLSMGETAQALDISEATAKRDWRRARAWLQRALAETESTPGDPLSGETSEGQETPPASHAA